MVAWRDNIEITVEIAFGDAPKATSPTWTDVSDYVRVDPPITINRGTSSELSGISPGTMTLHLDNRDRRFDPDYALGPYYGDLVPMVKIRLTAQLSVTSVTLFTGYVLGWTQRWTLGGDGTVEVSAIDGSRFVSNAVLEGSAYQAEVLKDDPLHYWPLQNSAADRVTDAELTYPDSPYWGGYEYVTTSLPLDGNTAVVGTENDVVARYEGAWTSPITALSFWVDTTNYLDDPDSGFLVSGSYYDGSDQNLLSVNFTGTTYGDTFDVTYANFAENKGASVGSDAEIPYQAVGGIAHFALVASSTEFTVLVNGQVVKTFALTTPSPVFGSTTRAYMSAGVPNSISHFAVWTTAPSVERFKMHYFAGTTRFGHPFGERSGERIDRVFDEIGWPAGQRSIDTGDTVQGPYIPNGQTFLDYARQVADSEQGLIFFDVDGNIAFRSRNSLWRASVNAATFSDDGGTSKVRYYAIEPAPNHVDNIRNIVTTSYSTIGAITRRDQTSIDAYGEGREFVDCPTIPDARTASSLSAYVLRERKDPSVYIERLECHMRLADGLNEFETLASVELADIINVEHTPLGVGSPAERTVMVTGITHMIGASQWDVSLFCSAAPTQYDDAPYLTLGDADYGKVGATAGNKIPF